MRKVKLITFVLCSLLTALCEAQQSITWQKIYNGPANWRDLAYDVCQSSDGYFYAVGYTGPPYTIYVLKFNQYGDTLWSRVMVGRIANAVTASTDGGCVLTGDGDSSFIIKLNSSGNIVWQNSYGGNNIICYEIIRTADGGYIACGRDSEGLYLYGYILRIDSNGNLLWQRTYLPGDKQFTSILEVPNEGFIITGVDRDSAYIIKIDSSGNVLWEVRHRVGGRYTGFGSISRINQGFLIGIQVSYPYPDTVRSGFVRTDFDGNIIYETVFPNLPTTRSFDEFWDMKPINENRYVFAILTVDTVSWPLYFKARAIISDSMGNIVHQRLFFYGEDEWFTSTLPLSNGDILFTGASWSYSNNGWEDVYLVRTDSLLNAPPIAIISCNTEVPNGFRLQQNYPNPFNSETIIKFEIPFKSKVRLTVHDILGREIAILLNSELNFGSYEFKFKNYDLPSGIYFYSLHTTELSISRKMIIIK